MEETQSFRLTGTTEIVEIPIQHVDGQTVIYWESIEQAFPGARHVKNGEVPVTAEKDFKGIRIIPSRIKHCPGAILDVLSTTVGHGHANLSAALVRMGLADATEDAISANKAVDALQVVASPAVESISEAKPSFQQIVKLASKKAQVFEIEQHLISSLEPAIQKKVQASLLRNLSVQAHNDGRVEDSERLRNESDGCLQEMMEIMAKKADEAVRTSKEQFTLLMAKQDELNAKQDELNAKQDKIEQLQIQNAEAMQAKQDELNAKQDKIKQLQIQNAEAMQAKQDELNAKQDKIIQLEIQALDDMKKMRDELMGQFAVLQSRVQAVLTQTYELHEYPIPRLFVVLPQDPSGWNTMDPFSNKFRLYFLCECGEHTKSVDSNTEIHVAKHEGYEITRPTEFFQLYGSHVLTILKMLKFGISVAGVAVPAISHLVRADIVDQAKAYLKVLKDIEPRMDPVIDWMDKVSVNEGEAVDEFARQMENKEALAGADLRKLDTFLKAKDGDKVLGNLYRTVTDEGHVKWVCIDHYRENYQETTAKDFQRTLDAVGGSFDRSLGRVEVTLRSRVLAEQFFAKLGKARSVYELDVDFDWACTAGSLEVLEGALKTSRVSILRLGIRQFRTSNIPYTSAQYGVLFRIRGLPNMRILHVMLSNDIARLLSIQPKISRSLCKLSIEATPGSVGGKELATIAEVLKNNSTLTALDLTNNSIGDSGAKVLADALYTNLTLSSLSLNNNNIGDNGTWSLAEALRTNKTLTTLSLEDNPIKVNGALALSKSLKTNLTLTTLNLDWKSIIFIRVEGLTVALKTNSTVATLNLWGNSIGDDGAKALAEALKTNSTVATLYLQSNSIGDNGAKALAEALTTNSTVATLNLQSNSIGDNGAQALAETLKTNKTLAILDLRSNNIWFKGLLAFSELFEKNKTLTTLDLHDNKFGDKRAQALYEALKTSSTLITFDLTNNSIGDDGAKALAEALTTNLTVATLNLQSNSIGDNGAQALAETLKTNKTLTTLDLQSNSIGGNGAQALYEALKTNKTLTTLNLQSNSIGRDGAKALAEALKTNKTLTTLNLQSNSIGAKGAKALAEALKTNKTLTTLNLQSNSIGAEEPKTLAKALRTIKTLTTLNLQSDSIGAKGAEALAEACKTNSMVTISGVSGL
ncbi:unnamed protein product [Mortierella alpina]